MELPKFGRSGGNQGGMLDGIKSKLGFAGSEANDGYDQYYSDDDYDAYSDNYDDYSTYDEEEVEQEAYSSYAPVTTRSAGSSRARRSTSSSYATRSHPRLVSIDDVRANTQIPDRLNRDPLPARSTRSTGFSSRNTVGRASDYALSGSEIDTSASYNDSLETEDTGRSSNLHSDGYDSLFGGQGGSTSAAEPKPSSKVGINERPRSSSYDPYTAYEQGSAISHSPQRSLSVLKPVVYGEVESISRSLKAGDAVVLSLRNTPNQLSKRILDFSFGVASALDASVDCVADKVFVISRTPLSDAETMKLRNQGVL